MANQLGDRQESVPVVVEIFTATGVLAETFTFSGPASYFPNGILEVSYRDNKNNWVDFNPVRYILQAGGLAVKFAPGFRVAAGTLIRIVYLSPESGGSVSSLSIIRDAANAAKRANVDNIYDPVGIGDPLGVFDFPVFADPVDETTVPAKPVNWEGMDVTESLDMILKPFSVPYAHRGLSVGIHAARHESFIAHSGGALNPLQAAHYNFIPISKCRRVIGLISHDAENLTPSDEYPALIVTQYNFNGFLPPKILRVQTYRMDEFNQEELWLNFDCLGEWMDIEIINSGDNPDPINFVFESLIGEVS